MDYRYDEALVIWNTYPDITHVLRKSFVFFTDLEGQFSSVTHYQDVHFVVRHVQLLKCCKNKNSCLTHTWFRLT